MKPRQSFGAVFSGGRQIYRKGHRRIITCLALDPDGNFAVTGSFDGTVRVWMLRLEDLLEVAGRVVGRELTVDDRKLHDASGTRVSQVGGQTAETR